MNYFPHYIWQTHWFMWEMDEERQLLSNKCQRKIPRNYMVYNFHFIVEKYIFLYLYSFSIFRNHAPPSNTFNNKKEPSKKFIKVIAFLI